MIPFKTTPEQKSNLLLIVSEMRAAKVNTVFIKDMFELACIDQGIYDLMEMWSVAKNDSTEQAEILTDLAYAVRDYD